MFKMLKYAILNTHKFFVGLSMSEVKFYDYLVIGGEHHGQCFTGPHTRNLEIRTNNGEMAKLYARDEPAETIIPEVTSYAVYEHTRGDGKHFFIATNGVPAGFNVEEAILISGIAPVN